MAEFENNGNLNFEELKNFFGPNQVDQQVRQAICICWVMLPAEKRTISELEVRFRAIIERVIDDFKNDATSFGIDFSNNK
jgi:hypothetical protein